MQVIKKNVLNFIWVRKVVDISLLRPSTLPQLIVEVVEVVYIGLLRPSTIPQLIVEAVYVGQVLPDTLPLVIVEDVGRGGSRSQDTRHSSSCNRGTIVDAEWRYWYRSQTSQYSSHNQGELITYIYSIFSTTHTRKGHES